MSDKVKYTDNKISFNKDIFQSNLIVGCDFAKGKDEYVTSTVIFDKKK